MSEDGQAIPHALGVEKAVLSVLMQYADEGDACPQLCGDHFHIPAHRIIFEKLKGMRSAGEEFEMVSFVQGLLTVGMLDRVGGAAAVYELYTYQPAPGAFERHVGILSEFRAARLAIKAAGCLSDAAMNASPDELAAACSEPISAILDAMTDNSAPMTTREIITESIERFESRAKGTETAMGIPTIPLIDDRLRGAHPGRLWVIGAYPEGGKSVMASQMILDTVTEGHPALFLSLEMPERDLMDRMIVQASRIEARAFTEPLEYARENGGESINEGLMRAIQNAIPKLRDAPLRMQRPANRKLPTVIAAIRKAHREMGIKISAVDYLQLIRGGDHGTKEGEISEISHALQECAGDLGITIVVLSQLNADGETKHGRVIEEDADAVLNIVQDRNKESETYKMHRYVLIAKDRHYGTGGTRIPLILDRDRIRFVEGQDETSQTKPKFSR